MAQLSKEQVLKANDILTEIVPVPEWGGEVTVAVMSGPARDEWEMMLYADGKPDNSNHRARLCAMCIIDPQTGERMFTVEELSKKSGLALNRVFEVAMRLNRIGTEAIEEASKNSGGPGSDSSTT